jgi:hypothetical protein
LALNLTRGGRGQERNIEKETERVRDEDLKLGLGRSVGTSSPVPGKVISLLVLFFQLSYISPYGRKGSSRAGESAVVIIYLRLI